MVPSVDLPTLPVRNTIMTSEKTQGDPGAPNLLDTPMPLDRAALTFEPLSNGIDQSGIHCQN